MATRYIVTAVVDSYSKKQVAEGLSRSLYNLQKPESIKDPKDVTEFMFGIIEHPVNTDEFAVVVEETKEVKKHADADPNELLAYINHLTNEEETQLIGYINANDNFLVSAIINELGEDIKTQAEMDTDGWFPEESI